MFSAIKKIPLLAKLAEILRKFLGVGKTNQNFEYFGNRRRGS